MKNSQLEKMYNLILWTMNDPIQNRQPKNTVTEINIDNKNHTVTAIAKHNKSFCYKLSDTQETIFIYSNPFTHVEEEPYILENGDFYNFTEFKCYYLLKMKWLMDCSTARIHER